MRKIKTFSPIVVALLFTACAGRPPVQPSPADHANTDLQRMIDTGKLKSEVNDLLNSISNGKSDTAKLKAVGADVLSTAATVLSDSGVTALYGNSSDPAVKEAGDLLKKMRNSIGITPDKLDSMKKAAGTLRSK